MKMNELRDEAYRIAKEHGWHDQEYPEKHWFMLVISEVAEVVEADRYGKHADRRNFQKEYDRCLKSAKREGLVHVNDMNSWFGLYIKDSVEDEIADVFIRLLDLSGHYDIDLDKLPNPFSFDPDKEFYISQLDEVKAKSMTEFAFDLSELLIKCCQDGIRFGDIHIAMHWLFLKSLDIGFNLGWHIKAKMEYNRYRPYRHGKKY